MADYDHIIGQDDTLEEIEDVIKVDGAVQDLTNVVGVDLNVREVETGTVTVFTAAVSDAAAGKVKYTWTGTDTATAGLYHYKWKLTYASGDLGTWPNHRYATLYIFDDIS